MFEWARELLDGSSTSLGQLDCIAFGAGPGSFTGVRVAVALAQGLGYAGRLPLCPVSTLATLAAGAFRQSAARVVACCLDAHMGEVYVGVYRRDAEEGVLPLISDFLARPEDVTLPGDEVCCAVGPGWAAYPLLAERFRGRIAAVESGLLPSAGDMAVLARARFLSGRVVKPADAQPNYLRHSVAAVPSAHLTGRKV